MSPSMSPIELYNEVKNTVKPVLYAASGWVSWIIVFGHVFGLYDTEDGAKSETDYAQRVYEVIEFLFFLVLVVCVQKMLSHLIAFRFHETAYKERLETVQNTLRATDTLAAAAKAVRSAVLHVISVVNLTIPPRRLVL